jgi:hypothetical protein
MEELIRSGFKSVFSAGSYAVSSCAAPLAKLPAVPTLSAADKNCILSNQRMQAKSSQGIIGFIFLTVSGLLLYFVVREQFFK